MIARRLAAGAAAGVLALPALLTAQTTRAWNVCFASGTQSCTAIAATTQAQVGGGTFVKVAVQHAQGAAARSAHLSSIRCPTLFLSGESDPFARLDLLRAAVATVGGPHELVTYPRLGHTLKPVLDDVLDRVAAFLREVPAATGD